MIERKIKFTVIGIKYENEAIDICRAVVRIKGENNERVDIVYNSVNLVINKEYEALVISEVKAKVFRVKEIKEVDNIGTFVKEALANDKKITKEDYEDIVKSFEQQSLEELVNKEALISLSGFDEEKAEYISKKVKAYIEMLRVKEYLRANNIKASLAEKIYESLGEKAIEAINRNPYVLLDFEVNLKSADKLAKSLGFNYNSEIRVKYGILEYLKYNADYNGHVFIDKEELMKNLSEYMSKLGGYLGKLNIEKELITKALDNLENEKEINTYYNADNIECIYISQLYDCETGIAEIISRKIINKTVVSREILSKIDDFIKTYSQSNAEPTKDQVKAIKNAVTENISVLSGFPGTGKTSTLTAIVGCIKHIYEEAKIEVVAFTGRAVSRINEILPQGMEAKTIHRLLGIGKSGQISERVLDIDFLIMDESTLISMPLMYAVLSRLKADTKILFVGDQNQITSGIGQVFSDISNSSEIKGEHLTKILRQDGNSVILKNIKKMAEYTGFTDKSGLKCKNGEFEFVEIDRNSEIKNKIEEEVSKLIKEGYTLNDVQILSPIKSGKGGTYTLNKTIQEKFNPNPKRAIYNLVAGDRVMQNINDYNRSIFNGETGIIIRNEVDGNTRRVTVKFNSNKIVEYMDGNISELEPCYAMTIHKSQGSQFPIVIIPVLKEHKSILNSNILYTGCSRAEKRVILIGNKETFDTAIKNPQSTKNSNLNEMIEVRIKENLDKIA
ncbi:AAA family ATPase [Clostridium saccharobutylicum]|uniref:ATP-dependent RecD-like DNA helicase n=1 Tax=Clostridium saccharobutylicum TaxID=169679 RepID=A0A1S8MZG3_CLOSA|nr:AAA family ATPase [Clostridium saccharobutylicum]OOM09451.1 ATP-dependent RecD-like DNA helicase [Clostridium saccharobutylicum]